VSKPRGGAFEVNLGRELRMQRQAEAQATIGTDRKSPMLAHVTRQSVELPARAANALSRVQGAAPDHQVGAGVSRDRLHVSGEVGQPLR